MTVREIVKIVIELDMQSETLFELVSRYLREYDFNGLFNQDNKCCCDIASLGDNCKDIPFACEAGYWVLCGGCGHHLDCFSAERNYKCPRNKKEA